MHNYELVLQHHGTKGMHWGDRNAEWYPISAWKAHLRKEGKSSDKNHSTEKISNRKRRKIEKKVAKQRQENLQKAREAKMKIAEAKKEKEEIIKTGDVEKAATRINDFTNEELRIIEERNRLKMSIAKSKADIALNKMGTISDATQKISNITTNSINIYNNLAKIANTFGDTELPIISQNIQNNNQEKNKK